MQSILWTTSWYANEEIYRTSNALKKKKQEEEDVVCEAVLPSLLRYFTAFRIFA